MVQREKWIWIYQPVSCHGVHACRIRSSLHMTHNFTPFFVPQLCGVCFFFNTKCTLFCKDNSPGYIRAGLRAVYKQDVSFHVDMMWIKSRYSRRPDMSAECGSCDVWGATRSYPSPFTLWGGIVNFIISLGYHVWLMH